LKVDIEHHLPGAVYYCGRKFIDPLTTADSHQDIKRTLSKLHLSANSCDPVEQVAINRVSGYLVTDGKTPLISHYCNRVIQLLDSKLTVKNLLHEEEYKMSMSWPQHDEELIFQSVAKELDLTAAELRERCAAIEQANSLDDFPVILQTRREIKIESEIGEQIHYTGDHTQDQNERNHPKTVENNPQDHQLEQNANEGDPKTVRRLVPQLRSVDKVEDGAVSRKTRKRIDRSSSNAGPKIGNNSRNRGDGVGSMPNQMLSGKTDRSVDRQTIPTDRQCGLPVGSPNAEHVGSASSVYRTTARSQRKKNKPLK